MKVSMYFSVIRPFCNSEKRKKSLKEKKKKAEKINCGKECAALIPARSFPPLQLENWDCFFKLPILKDLNSQNILPE